MKKFLEKENPEQVKSFKVNKADRNYRFWKRESLSIELFTPAVLYQKSDYIHYNPVKAGLCVAAEKYFYSSARFYDNGVDAFNMLTHYL